MNLDQMTSTDPAAVAAAVAARIPRRMISPKGTVVAVPKSRIPERLAAGYRLAPR